MAAVSVRSTGTSWRRLRYFLIFKGDVERAERRWREMGGENSALLTGLDLTRAEGWLPKRSEDLSREVVAFTQQSIAIDRAAKGRQLRAQRVATFAAVVAALFMASVGGLAWVKWGEADRQKAEVDRQKEQADAILSRATTIIVNLQSQMDDRTKQATFALVQAGADHGDVTSMQNLGVLYRDGVGVGQNDAKAREWFEKAADKGNGSAMSNLGVLYENGQGVAQDFGKAREWFEKAAEKGNASAMAYLGVLYQGGRGVAQDDAKAREWYEKAADKGDARAMHNLGVLYQDGRGVAQDDAKAREWYEKAANKGHASAMTNLGLFYQDGRGGAQDYVKAREWFEKAADKGEAVAMGSLGLLYQNGQGVAQDDVKAREWYQKAAEKGDAVAMTYLGLLYQDGRGVAQDYVKAREWYEKAAEKGGASAMSNLGWLYQNGRGVAQDFSKAREWYEKATDEGDARAKSFLKHLSITVAVSAGRYTEALRLQEGLVAEAEAAETEREGKPGKDTAGALNGVAWDALLARNYEKAVAVAERAHALFPNDLGIETNRAHALMFLGRQEEAKALYLAYKGRLVSGGASWESSIADDFAEFRKAGLTHPMMADIEKELNVSR
jgi:TPR repeat protein